MIVVVNGGGRPPWGGKGGGGQVMVEGGWIFFLFCAMHCCFGEDWWCFPWLFEWFLLVCSNPGFQVWISLPCDLESWMPWLKWLKFLLFWWFWTRFTKLWQIWSKIVVMPNFREEGFATLKLIKHDRNNRTLILCLEMDLE